MLYNRNGKTYRIPNIPQVGDYEYAKSLDCSCGLSAPGWDEKLKWWHCDGVYDSSVGLMVCFTCKRCGDKFFFHLRDNLDDYIDIGLMDEYASK